MINDGAKTLAKKFHRYFSLVWVGASTLGGESDESRDKSDGRGCGERRPRVLADYYLTHRGKATGK